MISFKSAVRSYHKLIDEFDGSQGVRDNSLLESALNRPYAAFDGNDLYPTAVDKTSAIFESLIINHPFADGNKRIAYVIMEVVPRLDNLFLDVAEDEKYQFVISASTGNIRFEEIRHWIETNAKPLIK